MPARVVSKSGMLPALDTTFQDARYALRGLLRNPGFACTAILASALGIGATTAVFSAVDRILFRALPYAQEDRLVSVGMMAPLDTNEFLLPETYFQLRRNPGPFESVTAFQAGSIGTDLTEGEPVRLSALRLESNFLSVLGMRPIAGRTFTRQEDVPNGPRVAMISYGLWHSRFAADPGVAGRTLWLDGAPVQIVGVLPRDFLMPTLAQADVILPLALNESTEHSGRALRAFARLKPGVTPRQALAELGPQLQRALQSVPAQFRKEVAIRVRPVRDRQLGDARMASLALLGSVAAVLLIACANIAGLLLARGVARQREMAVRAALGASRSRLARQTITESLVLSSIGGVLGCGLAWAMLRACVALAPAALPRLEEAAIDARVLLFALAAAVASGLLFGAAPALRSFVTIRGADRHATAGSDHRLRPVLIASEIAFSMILLTTAGLMLRSLWKLESVPLGLDSGNVLVARFELGRQRYAQAQQQIAFFGELEQRLEGAPGLDRAAITDSLPPSGGMRSRPSAAIEIEGEPPRPEGTGGMVGWRYVTPGYFATLGIPIVRGRGFSEQDRGPDAFTAILSESLARRLFPNQDPIGKRILKGPQGQWTTVIGVARDVTNWGPTRESGPEYYVLRKHADDFNFENQQPPVGWRAAAVVARTAVDPQLAAASLRSIIKSLDPALPVVIETMRQRVEQIDQRPRFYAILLSAFAAVGVLLAAIGLFGVMSFVVARRTREFGVRLALGATPAGILRMTLASALRWTGAGILVGAAGSAAAARLLQSLLFHVQPGDPVAIGAAVVLLASVALLAAAVPATRAARVDPVQALRQE